MIVRPARANPDFGEALRQLSDPAVEPDARLVRLLSAPSSEEMALWRSQWPRIPATRRRWISRCLLETAEASFEVDYRELCTHLLDDTDALVRRLAVDALWESDDQRLVGRLVSLLRDDADRHVRASAAAALGRFVLLGELDKIEVLELDQAVAALLDSAGDESEETEVRRRATESLGYADRPAVRETIREALSANEPELRAGALRAMGRSADGGWAPEVLTALDDYESELRFEAARAAGDLGLREAVPTLLAIAETDEPEIQLEAVWALGEIGGPTARRALERLIVAAAEREMIEAIEEALSSAALEDVSVY